MTGTNISIALAFLAMALFPFVLGWKRSAPSSMRVAGQQVVGERNYGAWRLSAGLAATFAGGSALLNTPSLAYSYGWWGLVDTIAVVGALLLSAALFAPLAKLKDALTLGTILGTRNPWQKLATGILSVIIYTLLAAAQILALTRVLAPHVPLPEPLIAATASALVAAYIFLHGYKAVTMTDVLQLVLMLLCFVVICGAVALGSWPPAQSGSAAPTPMPIGIVALLSLPLLFVPASQDLHIRVQSASNEKAARLGLLLAGLFYGLIGLVAVLVGLWTRRSGILLDNPDQALPVFIDSAMGAFSIIPTLAILAAVASSLDSTLFVAAASLAFDVAQDDPSADHKTISKFSMSTFAVLIAATLISLAAPRILSLILSALIVYVAALLPMLLAAKLELSGKDALVVFSLATAAIIAAELAGYSSPFRAFIYAALHALTVLTVWSIRTWHIRAQTD